MYTFTCPLCTKRVSMPGSSIALVLGSRQRICLLCTERRRKTAQLKENGNVRG